MPMLREYLDNIIPKNPTYEETVVVYDNLIKKRKALSKKNMKLTNELMECEKELFIVNGAIARVYGNLVNAKKE